MFWETESCPQSVSGWEIRERHFNCSNSNPEEVYHCLQDDYGRLGETCITGRPVRVQPNYCPEYNQFAKNVNTVPCNMSTGCPDVAFDSNQVYRYPVCLKGSTVYDDKPSPLPWNIIAPSVAVGVVVLFVVLIVVVLRCCRRRRTNQTTTQNEDQIPLLSRDIPFYKTSTFHEAYDFLKNGGKILCLIGQWGSGKSTTAKQLYMSITGRSTIVIEDMLKFDVSYCQESVIVDEPLPREEISEIEKSNVVEKLISLCKQIQKTNSSFVIITSTEEAWRAYAQEIKERVFQKNELLCLDLNLKNLTHMDRIQILHIIFEYYNPDTPFSRVEKVALKMQTNSFGFPELCTLLCRCGEFQKSPVLFVNRPLRCLSSYLERMCKSSTEKEKFVILVFMSVNDMKIDFNKENDKLSEIFGSCGLNINNVHSNSLIPEEFVVKEKSSVYVLQHEIIKRVTLITFGKFYFSVLLKYSSRKDLLDWIIHKKRTFLITILVAGCKEISDIEPFLEINDEQWIEYQTKLGMTVERKSETT